MDSTSLSWNVVGHRPVVWSWGFVVSSVESGTPLLRSVSRKRQGNTRLNRHRKGLGDLRSHQPYHVHRIRHELQELPECEGVEIACLLENVASMPREVRLQYDEWLGGRPVRVSAGQCGWVQRNRLYWLVSSLGDVPTSSCQVEGWSVTPCPGDVPELTYQGTKPIPARVNTIQGFKPMFDPRRL